MEVRKNEYCINTDSSKLDFEMIDHFLKHDSYWANKRPTEKTRTAIKHSICFGLYENEKQIGFARVVTDYGVIAYLADVFILPTHRGKGLSKWMMEVILSHPDLQGLRRWILATKDAHGLYAQSGFTPLVFPERWMERASKDAYEQQTNTSL